MLIHLHVKNLALIEEAEVDFGPGLNILTGETGAGKSILLGSIQMIFGARISQNMIRENAPYALVELVFQTDNRVALQRLKELEIEAEDGQILLSRKIQKGRSICRINGETCTLAQMKLLSDKLIDIHGQHEHQSLLYTDRQLEILDAYGAGRLKEKKDKVKDLFQAYRDARKALGSMDMDEEKRAREKAYLEFEIREIDKARLTPGEDEKLEQDYKKLSNGRKILEILSAVNDMTGYDRGAGEMTGRALHDISAISAFDPALKSVEETLRSADDLISDANREISAYLDSQSFDEESFREVEDRLDLINTLKSRYGRTIEDILKYRQDQQEKLDDLINYEDRMDKLSHLVKHAKEDLHHASTELSQCRKKYAAELTDKIIDGLKDLNFMDFRFQIVFDRKKTYSETGFDEICYQIATNPGEPLKPLGEIVSGGELSRIMLAIKAILADRDDIETLIFDEIDTGISGRTAAKVSEKMAAIGRHHQVLCITHLPQIAAMADTHFEIEKHVENQETVTQIHPLDQEASIRELARLLGGAEITEAVLDNARELKSLAK